MSRNFFIKKKSGGFTFIELIISVSIMALLFTLGTASFRQYQRKQFLDKVVRDIVSDMNYARSMALSGKKPIAPYCDVADKSLEAYDFVIVKNSSTKIYAIGVVCGDGRKCLPGGSSNTNTQNCLKSVILDQNINITFTSGSPPNSRKIRYKFMTLGSGAEISDPTGLSGIQVSYGGFSKTIRANEQGQISVN